MKRTMYFIITALLAVIYYLGGKPSEISEKTVMTAIGIDRTASGYAVTMQIFRPDGSGSDTIFDPSKPNVSIVKGVGSDVDSAVGDCMVKLGGKVFFGQNKLMLFGRGIDLSEKNEVFGFFLSSSERFLNVSCGSADNAGAVLETPVTGYAIASEKYAGMISSGEDEGLCINCTFIELLEAMETDGDIILPEFSLCSTSDDKLSAAGSEDEPDKLPAESEIEISGGALYHGGRYFSTISPARTGYAAALKGKDSHICVDTVYDGIHYSDVFSVLSRTVTPEVTDSGIVFHIECRLSPEGTDMFVSLDDKHRSDTLAAEEAERLAQDTADLLCRSSAGLLNADLYAKRFFPDLYRAYDGREDELYELIRFDVRFLLN